MLEKDFQKIVVEEAHRWGWKVAHFLPCKLGKRTMTAVGADGKGWPDLVLTHSGRGLLLFRELKQDRNYPTKEQRMWGSQLEAAGADWAVWKPKQMAEIISVLSGRSPSSVL